VILTFDCYSNQNDPVQHLRQYHDKMVINVRNNSILCQIFSPSERDNLRLVLLPSPRFIHNFRGLRKLFLVQYSSHQEFKQNNHHLFSVKMRPSDGLKAYISYFHNQLAKVHNCSAINGLRVSHTLYKHLVKYNVTRWSEILYRAQPYIELEEAMKNSANSSFNRGETEPNRSRNTESPLSTTRVAGNVLSRSDQFRTLNKAHTELNGWTTASLC